jgi:predicted transcriptional regulator
MEKKWHRVTVPICQEMNRLYDAGLTMGQVAEVLGFSSGVVNKYIWKKRKIIHNVKYIK